MFLSDGYHVAVQNVQENWIPRKIEVMISTIKIDTKVKIKTVFIGLFYGLTKIGKLLNVLIV